MGSTVWKSSNKASYKLVYSDVFSHEGPCCTDDHDIDKISVRKKFMKFIISNFNIILWSKKKEYYSLFTKKKFILTFNGSAKYVSKQASRMNNPVIK